MSPLITSSRSKSLIRFIAVVLLAVVFTYTGVSKLIQGLGGEPAAPSLLTRFVGTSSAAMVAVGIVEVVLAAWLISGWAKRPAAAVELIALASFTGVLAAEATKEFPKPCGCAAKSAVSDDPEAVRRSLWVGVGRNLLLMGAAGAAALLAGVPLRSRPASTPAFVTPTPA